MIRAIKAEFLKLKGSRTIIWTSLVVLAYALLAVVLNMVLLDTPGIGERLASAGGAFGRAVEQGFYVLNWKNQLRVAVQGITGTWGVLLFSFVTAYVFAREYKERTEKNMLTTPIRREYYVAAKLIVVVCWAVALTLFSFAVHVLGLLALQVRGFAWTHVWAALGDALVATAVLCLTLPLIAFIAMWGRGYLRAMLFAFAVQMIGNGLITTDASPYWPWNMPVHLFGASWLPVVDGTLPSAAWAVAGVLCIVGLALAFRQVDVADDAT